MNIDITNIGLLGLWSQISNLVKHTFFKISDQTLNQSLEDRLMEEFIMPMGPHQSHFI
jgi:hypothetical protein